MRNVATAQDRVRRQFDRDGRDQLWVTDITEHRTREGKVYCAVVLDTFSRRVVGWSIDSQPAASLVTNTLGMAIGHALTRGVRTTERVMKSSESSSPSPEKVDHARPVDWPSLR